LGVSCNRLILIQAPSCTYSTDDYCGIEKFIHA
jgi:hypothetical protein